MKILSPASDAYIRLHPEQTKTPYSDSNLIPRFAHLWFLLRYKTLSLTDVNELTGNTVDMTTQSAKAESRLSALLICYFRIYHKAELKQNCLIFVVSNQ